MTQHNTTQHNTTQHNTIKDNKNKHVNLMTMLCKADAEWWVSCMEGGCRPWLNHRRLNHTWLHVATMKMKGNYNLGQVSCNEWLTVADFCK